MPTPAGISAPPPNTLSANRFPLPPSATSAFLRFPPSKSLRIRQSETRLLVSCLRDRPIASQSRIVHPERLNRLQRSSVTAALTPRTLWTCSPVSVQSAQSRNRRAFLVVVPLP